jgi:hypothetical protein
MQTQPSSGCSQQLLHCYRCFKIAPTHPHTAPTIAYTAWRTAAALNQYRISLACRCRCLQLLLCCDLIRREHSACSAQVCALRAAYANVGRPAACLLTRETTQQALRTAQRQRQTHRYESTSSSSKRGRRKHDFQVSFCQLFEVSMQCWQVPCLLLNTNSGLTCSTAHTAAVTAVCYVLSATAARKGLPAVATNSYLALRAASTSR